MKLIFVRGGRRLKEKTETNQLSYLVIRSLHWVGSIRVTRKGLFIAAIVGITFLSCLCCYIYLEKIATEEQQQDALFEVKTIGTALLMTVRLVWGFAVPIAITIGFAVVGIKDLIVGKMRRGS